LKNSAFSMDPSTQKTQIDIPGILQACVKEGIVSALAQDKRDKKEEKLSHTLPVLSCNPSRGLRVAEGHLGEQAHRSTPHPSRAALSDLPVVHGGTSRASSFSRYSRISFCLTSLREWWISAGVTPPRERPGKRQPADGPLLSVQKLMGTTSKPQLFERER
jgi:hypothetical protein